VRNVDWTAGCSRLYAGTEQQSERAINAAHLVRETLAFWYIKLDSGASKRMMDFAGSLPEFTMLAQTRAPIGARSMWPHQLMYRTSSSLREVPKFLTSERSMLLPPPNFAS
jgi:hypothetical protein